MSDVLITDRLSSEIDKMFIVANDVDVKRDKIIRKLEAAVDNMTLDPDNESDKMLLAKMSLVTAFSSALKDKEGSKRDNIKILQKQKDSDQPDVNHLVAGLIVKLASGEIETPKIRSMSLGETGDASEIDNILNERCEREGLTAIQDAEISFESKNVNVSEVIGLGQ